MTDAKRHAERALGAGVAEWLEAERDDGASLPLGESVTTTHAVCRNGGPVYRLVLSVECLADFDTKEPKP